VRRIGREIEIELGTTHASYYVCRIILGSSNDSFTTDIDVGRGTTNGCLSRKEVGNRKSAELLEHELQ
jgi:hypothetical protein